MADYEVSIPSKNIPAIGSTESAAIQKTLGSLKKQYGTIVDEVAANSNVPAELIYSFITFLSNGVNNKPFRTADKLVRSGLFSLSNKIGKGVLANEVAQDRMNAAEKSFLRGAGDQTLNDFLADEKKATWGINEHWKSAYGTQTDRISDSTKPINWENPKIAIQTGAIWIGQLWDKFSEQTKTPLDKVVVTMFLPYGSYTQPGTKRFILGRPFLMGSGFAKARSWNTDYTAVFASKDDAYWLPGNNVTITPGTTIPPGSAHIINPKGGWVGNVLRYMMGKHGSLDKLTV